MDKHNREYNIEKIELTIDKKQSVLKEIAEE